MIRWRGIVLLLLVLLLQACGKGRLRTSAEAVRLREEAVELNRRIHELEQKNRELRSALDQATTPSAEPTAAIRAATPQITELEIERLSFARDRNNDQQPDELALYVRSLDGRGRFEQMVGTLSATAVLLPIDGEPALVGKVTLDPEALRDAYRYSFMGVHYAVSLPLELPHGHDQKDVLVRVRYVDGRTGQELITERRVSLGL